jgi:hypothetical protein
MAMIDDVRAALRISVKDNEEINNELSRLINSAKRDLGVAGVVVPEQIDELVFTAIVTYCKMSFGLPEDYDRLKKSYDEQKAQLSNATGYTDWMVGRDV